MSKYDEPVGHTCPMIDQVVGFLSDLNMEGKITDSDTKYYTKLLEDIRRANDLLRQWGNEKCAEVELAEDRASDAEGKATDLQYRLDDLDRQLQELENKVQELGLMSASEGNISHG